jgi:hypothetical protein
MNEGQLEIYSGGDGSTIETAVVINATSTSQGIPAEYQYVSRMYGLQNEDWTMVQQNLVMLADKRYDLLHIRLSTGEEKTNCFDITRFYGRY